MDIELALRTFVEKLALYLESQGLPRPSARILGWLLVCDPPEQSMSDLVSALGVSKSSVSTAIRQLIQARLVERISLPGERSDYYRMTGDAFTRALEVKVVQMQQMRQLADEGLQLLADKSVQRQARLTNMRDMYAFFEEEMGPLFDRWYGRDESGRSMRDERTGN